MHYFYSLIFKVKGSVIHMLRDKLSCNMTHVEEKNRIKNLFGTDTKLDKVKEIIVGPHNCIERVHTEMMTSDVSVAVMR